MNTIRHRMRLLLILSALLPISLAWAAQTTITECYVKEATWPQTMHATRQAYRQWSQTDEGPAAGLVWGPWYQAGPFPSKSFSTVLAPEEEVKLKAKSAAGKRLWKKQLGFEDGQTHSLPPNVVGPTYLYRTITTSRAMRVAVGLGSDDGIMVKLNGRIILSKDVFRGVTPGQDRIELDLKVGVNDLLLKIYNQRGGHAFHFSSQPQPLLALWAAIERDFPRETHWMKQDLGGSRYLAWFDSSDLSFETKMIGDAIDGIGGGNRLLRRQFESLDSNQTRADDPAWMALYRQACVYRENLKALAQVNVEALVEAVEDLRQTFPDQYPAHYLQKVTASKRHLQHYTDAIAQGEGIDPEELTRFADEVKEIQRAAMLANPLLDFDRILVIRRNLGSKARRAMSRDIGMASLNSHNNTSIDNAATGWDNEIVVLRNLRDTPRSRVLYQPEGPQLITDVDLHWDADKLMFSMPGPDERWHVFEVGADGHNLRQITPQEQSDVDHFDSCYLPDENILFTSTASFQGLPCEGGSRPMALLYLMNRNNNGIRQLTFEQDSDWCPTILNNGRVLYLRWEYSDIAHYFSRILFHMNPDGTGQMEYLGSNSYFPNAYFYARPIPDHPTKVVGIVGGHHGISRSGRLVIFNPAQGRHEADGAVQEIPRRHHKIEPVIRDRLVDGVWPQFLHPYPLSDKYFLVSAKLNPESLWGIYLVDVFDNMTLVAESEGAGLFEPLALQARKRPPVIPEKVDTTRKDAIVFLTDVYRGQGLSNIPRGEVKRLRLFAYHFAHVKTGGHNSVGVESSWDIKRILGTVPVEADGSALFRIPANTPISVQPLDEQGRALQLMRSWFVGMPGEIVSCVGCHEPQNSTGPSVMTTAALGEPAEIEPWQGSARPFAFNLEIEPVLDRYCVSCHDGQHVDRPDFANRDRAGNFNKAYMATHPYVRRPGPESDIHVFQPMEYHANTSELVQMLKIGHHGVELDAEAWEILYTWIDLNVPFRGKWGPPIWRDLDQNQRRRELAKRYANIDDDPEGEYEAKARRLTSQHPVDTVKPKARHAMVVQVPSVAGWPFNRGEAVRKQNQAGPPARRTVDLGDNLGLDLALIPAGTFVMGDAKGYANEHPPCRVEIDAPFWMGTREITNAQYAQFDATHNSRYIDQQWKDHTTPGYPANRPDQPVIRISWEEAMAFCEWLSTRTGQQITLPTEAQWEWACRAGSNESFNFGTAEVDFSSHANLADHSIQLLAVSGVNPQPVKNPDAFKDFVPRDMRFNDGEMIVANVGQYQPNAWGLQDMHGNVSEWTRSVYAPYPYVQGDGDRKQTGQRVVRGGSWRDRPKRARSASRWAYESYQRVYNVGFRIVLEAPKKTHYATAQPQQ